jgi:hypothetical protein
MDFYPGPLGTNASCTPAESNNWDKLWKVNKTTIDSFKNITIHTLANTHPSILQWPAKGNVNATGNNNIALSITQALAPFVDVNNDNIYNALDGDYPKICGDQSIYTVFNDNTHPHNNTLSQALKLQISLLAYASKASVVSNTTFYEYTITNKSTSKYNNTIIALWDDIDLGNAMDDYIGYDSTYRMAIGYNGDSLDDNVYLTNLTQTGIAVFEQPSDEPSNKHLLGSMMYFNNNTGIIGNPSMALHYYNYSKATWIDDTHLKNTCIGYGAGQDANYYMPDDPSIANGLSEGGLCNNTPGDRRLILGSEQFTLDAGATVKFVIAVMNTPLGSNNTDFTTIKNTASNAYNYYISKDLPQSITDVNNTNFTIVPNPINNVCTVNSNTGSIKNIEVYNSNGQLLQLNTFKKSTSMQIDLSTVSNGLYFIKINSANGSAVKKVSVLH